jgi:hypothetical protein
MGIEEVLLVHAFFGQQVVKKIRAQQVELNSVKMRTPWAAAG